MKVSRTQKSAASKLAQVYSALRTRDLIDGSAPRKVAFNVADGHKILFLNRHNLVVGQIVVEYVPNNYGYEITRLKIKGKRIAVKLSGDFLVQNLYIANIELATEQHVEIYLDAYTSGAAKVVRHTWSSFDKKYSARTLKTSFISSSGEKLSITTTQHLSEVAKLLAKREIMLADDVWAQLLSDTNYPLAAWNNRTWLGNAKHRTIGRIAKELGWDVKQTWLDASEWETLLYEGIHVKDTEGFMKELFTLHESGINGGHEDILQYWFDTLSAGSALHSGIDCFTPVYMVLNLREEERTPWSCPKLFMPHYDDVYQEHDL